MKKIRTRIGSMAVVCAMLLVMMLSAIPAGAISGEYETYDGESFKALAVDGVIELTENVLIEDTVFFEDGEYIINLNGFTVWAGYSSPITLFDISGSAGVTINGPGEIQGVQGSFNKNLIEVSGTGYFNIEGDPSGEGERIVIAGNSILNPYRNSSSNTINVKAGASCDASIRNAEISGGDLYRSSGSMTQCVAGVGVYWRSSGSLFF